MKIKHKWYSALIAIVLAVALLVTPTASPVTAGNSPWQSVSDLREGVQTKEFEAPEPWGGGLAEFSFKQFGQNRVTAFEDAKTHLPLVGYSLLGATIFPKVGQLSGSERQPFTAVPGAGASPGIGAPSGGGCG